MSASNNTHQLLTVLVLVIVLLALFAILFYIVIKYNKYYSKCIENKLEDEEIRKRVISDNKEFFLESEKTVNDSSMSKDEKLSSDCFFMPIYDQKAAKKNNAKKITLVKNIIFYTVFSLLFIVFLFASISGNLINVGKRVGVIVSTGSMESANNINRYLFDNDLNDRIKAKSFITLDKVEESGIAKYDIIGYKDPDGNIIVHRVIDIKTKDGVKVFECRGDANSGSFTFEVNLEYKNVIGKYSGYQSQFLGVLLSFIKSFFGIMTLVVCFAVLFLYEKIESKTELLINSRMIDVINEIDSDIKYAINNNTNLDLLSILDKKK